MKNNKKKTDWSLSLDSFKNLPSFMAKLRAPADPVSTMLKSKLPEKIHQDLEVDEGDTLNHERIYSLMQALNVLIHGPSMYKAELFAGVEMRPKTKMLFKRNRRGRSLVRLNRMLLEDAYPLEILRTPPYIHFVVSDADVAAIKLRVPYRVSLSEFLKSLALGQPVPKARGSVTHDAYFTLLCQVAMAINYVESIADSVIFELAHGGNALDCLTAAAELASIRELVLSHLKKATVLKTDLFDER